MTPNLSKPSLCRSCSSATIVHGSKDSEEMIFCSELPTRANRITWHVVKCNAYTDRSLPSLHELSKIAWDLVDKGGRKIGFRSPIERKRDGVDEWSHAEPLSAPWDNR